MGQKWEDKRYRGPKREGKGKGVMVGQTMAEEGRERGEEDRKREEKGKGVRMRQ